MAIKIQATVTYHEIQHALIRTLNFSNGRWKQIAKRIEIPVGVFVGFLEGLYVGLCVGRLVGSLVGFAGIYKRNKKI